MEITKSYILERFYYDCENGLLINKRSGKCSTTVKNGNLFINLSSIKRVKLSKLIYLVETGIYHTGNIIHIDGDKLNCKFQNLELVPPKQKEITKEYILSLFDYNREEGKLYYKFGNQCNSSGDEAGIVNSTDSKILPLNGKVHHFSHIIFLIENDRLPKRLRYKDGNYLNCRISNIEEIIPKKRNTKEVKFHDKENLPSRSEILKRFDYDKVNGTLTYKINIGNVKIGDLVKRTSTKGYIIVKINSKIFAVHRIIWFLENGEWPYVIDHINQNKSDNRIENLRNVDFVANAKNKKIGKSNTSGFMGVSWIKNLNKWQSYINYNNKRIILGYFENKEDAIKARKEAERKYGYHENHGRE